VYKRQALSRALVHRGRAEECVGARTGQRREQLGESLGGGMGSLEKSGLPRLSV